MKHTCDGPVVSADLSAFLRSSEHTIPSGGCTCSLHAPSDLLDRLLGSGLSFRAHKEPGIGVSPNSQPFQDRLMYKMSTEYAAGMFDADGSVTISKRIEQRSMGEYRRYQVRVSLLSISPTVPALYKEMYGGSLHYEDKSIKNPNWRPSHTWIAVSRVASSFLSQIAPFLINKQEEAYVALALEESIAAHRYNLRKFPERQSVLEYRESLRQKITFLKKRSYPLSILPPD